MNKAFAIMIATACSAVTAQPVIADTDTERLFKKKCSICHKIDKKGMGPTVTKMTLDATVLKSVITYGRGSMPTFEKKLSTEKIDALVAFIQSKQPASTPCAKNTSGK